MFGNPFRFWNSTPRSRCDDVGVAWLLLRLKPAMSVFLPEGVDWEDVEQEIADLECLEVHHVRFHEVIQNII